MKTLCQWQWRWRCRWRYHSTTRQDRALSLLKIARLYSREYNSSSASPLNRQNGSINRRNCIVPFLHERAVLLDFVDEGGLGIFAIGKPPGVLSHPNDRSDKEIEMSLITLPYDLKGEYYYSPDHNKYSDNNSESGIGSDRSGHMSSSRKIWLLNRLDVGTSGLILCCDNLLTKLKVQRIFADRLANKKYIAKVFGLFKGPKVWDDYIEYNRVSSNEIVARCQPYRGTIGGAKGNRHVGGGGAGGGNIAKTTVNSFNKYRFKLSGKTVSTPGGVVVDPPPFMSLVSLHPTTGLTHQLRVQCQSRGWPIVGDRY